MKTELKSLILTGALCASTTTAFAQGTVLFTWHGDQNLFQANLTLDASLVYPGSIFWPGADQPWTPLPVTATGLIVTSQDCSWPDGSLDSTPCPPGDPFYSHINAFGHPDLYVNGSRLWIADFSFTEYDTSGKVLYGERGTWLETPEPSTFALLGLGLLALGIKEAANR